MLVNADKQGHTYWIVKPCGSSQGKGIYITNHVHEIQRNQSLIVSKYIQNPLTIDGLKFDLRLYVVITSVHPLRIYLFDEGLTRFASEKYCSPENDDELKGHNKFVHLTNYSINKSNKTGVRVDTNVNDGETSENKWSLMALKKCLRAHKVNDDKLFNKIKDILIKTVISCETTLNASFEANVPYKNNCF
jgi:hypothetical protein